MSEKVTEYVYERKTTEERREIVRRGIAADAAHARARERAALARANKEESYAKWLEHRLAQVDSYDDRALDLIIADWLAVLKIDEADRDVNAARNESRREIFALLTPIKVSISVAISEPGEPLAWASVDPKKPDGETP